MKNLSYLILTAALLAVSSAGITQDYTYFIRQVQMPDEGEWDVDVPQEGSQESPLPINPNGARFELYTVQASPLKSYLLDTTYVNSYIPVAEVEITSQDPYDVIPRTRADQPFTVTIYASGLSSDPAAPEAARSVKLLRHVQVYQGEGNGQNVNRNNATLISQGSISDNGTQELNYALTQIPGADRLKVRGEERFSVFSLEDVDAPESQLDSQFVQIWPVADSTLSGITAGQKIKGSAPDISVELNDLYPDSWTFAQVYEGNPVLGTEGTLVPGSSLFVDSAAPRDEDLTLTDWDSVIEEDGIWTLEIITITPFGADRLAHVTFEIDRVIEVNGNVTSLD